MTLQLSPRLNERLRTELVIWLTTVNAGGVPAPTPVWFWWDGAAFLIFSQPNTHKVRNIARQPTVTLNFNSDAEGGDVAVFTGTAALETQAPPLDQVAAYVEKYREGMRAINLTPESMAPLYSVAIRVRPARVRGD